MPSGGKASTRLESRPPSSDCAFEEAALAANLTRSSKICLECGVEKTLLMPLSVEDGDGGYLNNSPLEVMACHEGKKH